MAVRNSAAIYPKARVAIPHRRAPHKNPGRAAAGASFHSGPSVLKEPSAR
jgi:hypothetical protein